MVAAQVWKAQKTPGQQRDALDRWMPEKSTSKSKSRLKVEM
jgi:hypothetical protein